MAAATVQYPKKSLLGIGRKTRRLIFLKLLTIEANEVTILNPPVTEDETEPNFDRKVIHKYKFEGLGLLTTCKQLHEEASKVLLEENRFLAIIGRQQLVAQALRSVDTPFWMPPWEGKWRADTGCFEVSKLKVRPEMAAEFPLESDTAATLVPACEAVHAVYAIHHTERFPTNNPHLNLTFTIEFAEDFMDFFDEVMLWLGGFTNNVRVVRGFEPEEPDQDDKVDEMERYLKTEAEAWQHMSAEDRKEELKLYEDEIVDNINAAIEADNEGCALSYCQQLGLMGASVAWELGIDFEPP
jgi:hypothetical protein